MTDQKPWYQKKKHEPSFPFVYEWHDFKYYPFHWHDFLEVVYVHEGRIFASVEGQIFESKKGDIVIINAGLIHGFFEADPGTAISIFQFWFDLFDHQLPDLRERVFQKLSFSRKIFISSQTDAGLQIKMEKLLTAIRDEYLGRKDGSYLAIKARLYDFALLFVREIPDLPQRAKEVEKRSYNHQKIERIFSFIHENYSDPSISLDHAADKAALSKFYFTRFFKEHTGQTFHTYLSKLRLCRAEEYLSESDMSVTDIAYQCGFASLKTFNRLFRNYTGTSPSCYRSGKWRKMEECKKGNF